VKILPQMYLYQIYHRCRPILGQWKTRTYGLRIKTDSPWRRYAPSKCSCFISICQVALLA